MSIYPTVRPELTLDFQKSKQLDPRILFSRPQATNQATYIEGGVVKYADEHEARFEDEGLLLEEQRSNEVIDNNQLLDVTSNGSPSTTVGPDGQSNSATRITATSSGTVEFRNATNRSITWSSNTQTTWSFYFKPSNLTSQTISASAVNGAGQGGAEFNCATLTATLTGSSSKPREAADIIPVGNGWFRCWIRYNNTLNPTVGARFAFNAFEATASDYFDVCFLQVEEGSFPTSYIPTSGSESTRAADIATITGDNFNSWFNQSESTLFVNMSAQKVQGYSVLWNIANRIDGFAGYVPYEGLIYFNDGTTDKYIGFGGTGEARWIANVPSKCAYSWNFDDGTGSVSLDQKPLLTEANGSNGIPVPSFSARNLFSFTFLGQNGQTKNTGHIARMTYYPRRLSNSELEALTI